MHLLKIYPETWNGEVIGNLGDLTVQGLAFDPINRILYGVEVSGIPFNGVPNLISIDINTGSMTHIGDFAIPINNPFYALAYNISRNVLYASDRYTTGIFEINPSNANFSFIGPLEIPGQNIEGLAYDDSSGVLYGSSDTYLFSIDTQNGAGTIIGPHNQTLITCLALAAPIPPFNQVPVADCGQERVIVFDEVTLDGSASYDPDGTIETYEWSLQHEDGSTIPAFGSNPTITHIPSGFYDVSLTVTDDGGLVDTDNMLLAAAGSCFCTASTTYVESIVAGTIKGKIGKVTVTIFDNCGNPVPSATVTGTFSGDDFNETGSGLTNANGVSVILTTAQVKKPSYEFCVDDVDKGTLIYEPNDNVETCETK
jgi:hypothetical protein